MNRITYGQPRPAWKRAAIKAARAQNAAQRAGAKPAINGFSDCTSGVPLVLAHV